MSNSDDRDTSLAESLVVMDVADRLRRRDDRLSQATDIEARRKVLRARLNQLYARQGIDMAPATLDRAIAQTLDHRLLHQSPRGISAALARLYVRLVDGS